MAVLSLRSAVLYAGCLLATGIHGFLSLQAHPWIERKASYIQVPRSSSDSSSANMSDDDTAYYDTQDVLLCLQLCPTQDNALERVQSFVRSFPFAAVLPVQPLTYLPTADGGVEIKFLRKPTDAKSGVDGGIRIFVKESEVNKILVTAKRNDRGQTCQKIFSEKAIVTKLVAALTGQDTGLGLDRSARPLDIVQVDSLFHIWMDNM